MSRQGGINPLDKGIESLTSVCNDNRLKLNQSYQFYLTSLQKAFVEAKLKAIELKEIRLQEIYDSSNFNEKTSQKKKLPQIKKNIGFSESKKEKENSRGN